MVDGFLPFPLFTFIDLFALQAVRGFFFLLPYLSCVVYTLLGNTFARGESVSGGFFFFLRRLMRFRFDEGF